MACCHFTRHPRQIRTGSDPVLLIPLPEPPARHHWPFVLPDCFSYPSGSGRTGEMAITTCCPNRLSRTFILFKPIQLFQFHVQIWLDCGEGLPPFPIRLRSVQEVYRKWGCEWSWGWGSMTELHYLAWEISRRFITLQLESGETGLPCNQELGTQAICVTTQFALLRPVQAVCGQQICYVWQN